MTLEPINDLRSDHRCPWRTLCFNAGIKTVPQGEEWTVEALRALHPAPCQSGLCPDRALHRTNRAAA